MKIHPALADKVNTVLNFGADRCEIPNILGRSPFSIWRGDTRSFGGNFFGDAKEVTFHVSRICSCTLVALIRPIMLRCSEAS